MARTLVKAWRWVAVFAAVSAAPLSVAAAAQGAPLVVTMRGSSNEEVTKPLAREIRRGLVDVLGPLRSSRAWRAAVRTMGLSPSDSLEVEDMAKAARAVGAEHLLDMTVYRQKQLWVLQVRLIRVADARVLRRPRYPYASMNVTGQRWHAKQIIDLVVKTLAQEARGG